MVSASQHLSISILYPVYCQRGIDAQLYTSKSKILFTYHPLFSTCVLSKVLTRTSLDSLKLRDTLRLCQWLLQSQVHAREFGLPKYILFVAKVFARTLNSSLFHAYSCVDQSAGVNVDRKDYMTSIDILAVSSHGEHLWATDPDSVSQLITLRVVDRNTPVTQLHKAYYEWNYY